MPARHQPVPDEQRIALRLDDAATVTGLSRSTLYNLINNGTLKDCRVAGRRRILRSDLEDLIHSGVEPAPESKTSVDVLEERLLMKARAQGK